MNAISNARAQPGPVESLAQNFFAFACCSCRHIRSRDQIAPQQCGQSLCIQAVRFNLRIGNQSRFERMGQHHFLHLLYLFEQIVDASPIPARFHYHFARTLQRAKKLSEAKSRVAANAAPSQLPASLMYCNKHTIALVNVYSNVVDEQQSPFGVSFASHQHQTQTAFMLPALFASSVPDPIAVL